MSLVTLNRFNCIVLSHLLFILLIYVCHAFLAYCLCTLVTLSNVFLLCSQA